jgi:hypothetical protein
LDIPFHIRVKSTHSIFFSSFAGRSYGGACCNSILKVLYDAANEAVDATHNNNIEGLFDEDDDESLATVPFGRNDTFASLDMNGQANPSTISWAEVLRKMKIEMAEIEYPQAPTISSTRKFDLNQPFSLVPENFDKATGKKRSLLIGCNYRSTPGAELKASHDDVRSMKVRFICVVKIWSQHQEIHLIFYWFSFHFEGLYCQCSWLPRVGFYDDDSARR